MALKFILVKTVVSDTELRQVVPKKGAILYLGNNIYDKTGYDISDIVEKVTWSGRKNSPARTLQLQLLDDPDVGEENRPGIDVYEGHHLVFLEDDEERFRGIIMTQSRTHDRKLTVTAYDSAIYLSNNKDSFVYKNKTLTEIFLDVCKRYGLSRGECAAVQYKIPAVSKVNTTIYDILCTALSKTYEATGERYFILVKNGQLHLIRRSEQITKLVLETGAEGSEYGNITEYSYTKDISSTKTRLKLISQNGKTVAQWRDGDLEERLGMLQDVQIPNNGLSAAKLKSQVIVMLNDLKKPKETLNVSALGISSIYTGIAVYISIPEIGIGRTFYVDSDTHSWEGDFHTMKLTLNFATDLESINDKGETETEKNNSAYKDAEQSVKNAGTVLKAKKAAEKIIINCGKKAEAAANKVENALKAIRKAIIAYNKAKNDKGRANQVKKIEKQLATAKTQSELAQSLYEQSKVALAEAKALINFAQADLTTNADFASQQAESNARRAKNDYETAVAESAEYL
ncbi:MAG: hypothetical protein K6G83_09525 [Lachnospiraceae bacterium]|nr:hypothetical protein [Lachnospiraceae bacterium]